MGFLRPVWQFCFFFPNRFLGEVLGSQIEETSEKKRRASIVARVTCHALSRRLPFQHLLLVSQLLYLLFAFTRPELVWGAASTCKSLLSGLPSPLVAEEGHDLLGVLRLSVKASCLVCRRLWWPKKATTCLGCCVL